MKTAAIIAEYNPLHNGHGYHIEETRRITGADAVVVLMSGNYVERGTPACIDVYPRARMCLAAGADLVLELPSPISTGSAEIFADGAIHLLESLGFIDFLSFGSEEGDLAPLKEAADILAGEPESFRVVLREKLREGKTFAEARNLAVNSCLGHSADSVLGSPNNILAVEYLKSLKQRNLSIEPVTVTRRGSAYHDERLGEFASATAIRGALANGSDISGSVPDEILPIYNAYLKEFRTVDEDCFSAFLTEALIRSPDLTGFSDVSREIADRIRSAGPEFGTFRERIQAVKTRQYSYTRISRALLHILLGITPEETCAWREGSVPYLHVLGLRRNSPVTGLLKNCTAPLLINYTDRRNLPEDNSQFSAAELLRREDVRRDLYRLAVYQSCGKILPDEVHAGPIFL